MLVVGFLVCLQYTLHYYMSHCTSYPWPATKLLRPARWPQQEREKSTRRNQNEWEFIKKTKFVVGVEVECVCVCAGAWVFWGSYPDWIQSHTLLRFGFDWVHKQHAIWRVSFIVWLTIVFIALYPTCSWRVYCATVQTTSHCRHIGHSTKFYFLNIILLYPTCCWSVY